MGADQDLSNAQAQPVAAPLYYPEQQQQFQQQQQQQQFQQVQVQQVMAQQPQIVVTQAAPLDASTSWATGVCGGCSCEPLCCNVYWCSPCMTGRNHNAVMKEVPDNMDYKVCGLITAVGVGGEATRIIVGAAVDTTIFPFGALLAWMITSCYTQKHRTALRTKYGIPGDACIDCLSSWFCTPCVMCQHHVEATRRGFQPGLVCCKAQPALVTAHTGQVVQPAYPMTQVAVQPAPAAPSAMVPVTSIAPPQGQAVV
eukprot:TRINITY_DN1962_c0_g7_i1.p1 TRINITY_DN1962_c0_g7~~TRINITY_DN1962_c0_g7_i1.p1  ORF type:complete len:255 (+),score=39.97 TRINITY_DN1962_c0_g7_i1:66-830(+)